MCWWSVCLTPAGAIRSCTLAPPPRLKGGVLMVGTSVLPKNHINQPKVPQHSTLSSMPPSTPTCDLGLKMHPLTPLQHAYPTPKCQNGPLEPRIASQKLRLCVWTGFCEIYSTHPATAVCVVGGGTKSVNQNFPKQKSEKTKVGQNHPKISVVKSVCRQTDGKAVNREVVVPDGVGGGHMCV